MSKLSHNTGIHYLLYTWNFIIFLLDMDGRE